MEHAAQRPKQGGFAEARDPLQQNVASRQQADEDAIDHMLLTDDDFADFLAHLVEVTGGELD
jgi:hypothetical protein